MIEKKDRSKGPTVFYLTVFVLFLTSKIISRLFSSTYEFGGANNILSSALLIMMIISTIIFLIYFIKNNILAKLWLHLSAGTYLLSAIISFLVGPTGNEAITGGAKIGPFSIQIFYIALSVFYWFMLRSYFNKFGNKYK